MKALGQFPASPKQAVGAVAAWRVGSAQHWDIRVGGSIDRLRGVFPGSEITQDSCGV